MIQLQDDLLGQTPPPSWLKKRDRVSVGQAIEFGASLWLFSDVSGWKDEESLREFVRRVFVQAASNNQAATAGSVVSFNARMLNQIGGMELVWRSNIRDHLLLDLSDRMRPRLFVFRHASCLGGGNDPGGAHSDVMPDGLLRETAETIALLFPFAEAPQRRWDQRVRKRADIDVETGVACNAPRCIDQYVFWQHRLALIEKTFNSSKPNTLSQWYHDKRNTEKRATFWFAVVAIVLTLIFGLIQSITGIIQVTKS